MDIERLEEHDLYVLRDVVSGLEEEQSIDPVIARQFEKVIDEAIARQSATSEEVTEAISHIQGGYGDIWQWPKKRRDTIITALQAYQPNISKTETTGCEWCDHKTMPLFYVECARATIDDESQLISAIFCPNCGRNLKGE